MPLHLNAVTRDDRNPELLAWLFDHGLQNPESVVASENKKYLHLTRFINDAQSADQIGKFVFTLKVNEEKKALEILDLDMVISSDSPTPLHFLKRLEPSSDANEYYEVVTVQGQHLEVETVHRHAINENLLDTTRGVYVSAFPFALEIFDDINEFNALHHFKKAVQVGNTDYTVGGYAEDFAATGSAFGAGKDERFSFLLGKITDYKDVSIRLGPNSLNFVIAILNTALGQLPTVMSREAFDLRKLSAEKLVAMKADIKVDLLK